MSEFEDPMQFDEKKEAGDVKITYSDLMEVSQGGPVVGNISINGERLPGRFGGPILIEKKHIYVPVQVKRFLGTGFKLAKINLDTLQVQQLGEISLFIYLDRIEENRVYYFEDMEKTIQKYYQI